MGALPLLFAVALAQQVPCETLRSLSLQNATVTAAEHVAAGPLQTGRGRGGPATELPAHCRVALTLKPSSDSHIEMELWMPAENWNGKFLAVGNGGWAGNIETRRDGGGPVARLRQPLRTIPGTRAAAPRSALGHPEKLVDFGYRAMHEMTVQSKALIAGVLPTRPRSCRTTRAARPAAARE